MQPQNSSVTACCHPHFGSICGSAHVQRMPSASVCYALQSHGHALNHYDPSGTRVVHCTAVLQHCFQAKTSMAGACNSAPVGATPKLTTQPSKPWPPYWAALRAPHPPCMHLIRCAPVHHDRGRHRRNRILAYISQQCLRVLALCSCEHSLQLLACGLHAGAQAACDALQRTRAQFPHGARVDFLLLPQLCEGPLALCSKPVQAQLVCNRPRLKQDVVLYAPVVLPALQRARALSILLYFLCARKYSACWARTVIMNCMRSHRKRSAPWTCSAGPSLCAKRRSKAACRMAAACTSLSRGYKVSKTTLRLVTG